MSLAQPLNGCLAFLRSQLELETSAKPRPTPTRLTVTLSRQTGTGGRAIAEQLASYLGQNEPTRGATFTVVHKDLVERVLAEHDLPREMARFMTENRVSQLKDMMEQLFGLHPSAWTLAHKTAETILHLAEHGNVILVGRGANFVAAKIPHAFHVRLVGSLDRRVVRLQSYEHLEAQAARDLINRSDHGRRAYVQDHFRKSIDDPVYYDLVLNTDRMADAEVVRLIAEASKTRCSTPATSPAYAMAERAAPQPV